MASFFTSDGPASDESAAPAPEPARRSWLKRLGAVLSGAALATPAAARPANPDGALAGGDVFVGEIIMLACNFAPRGYALCNGQLLPIAQNTALFSLLGTTYGGNGQTTFALPNLQGHTPIGRGDGPGLTPRVLGEQIGAETTTLLFGQMPAHTHAAQVSTALATSNTPTGNVTAEATASNASGEPVAIQNRAATANASGAAGLVSNTGSNVPVSLQSPYLAVNYCIALQGVFPPR
ncbi:tail fiber protein [Hymenobacter sp. 5317J-9]|uniref:phage tail protein n=1 Tax=Hymenobacter sp. 5317J-9 TaxID=2932250 RepID=UPI001FD6C4E6|nr:tail fiber protein [Hymenobacter sp. 5317J-9]UOQ96463.1 tail fiber protein [Hymenobacter sp. 5317J-9]